MRCPNCHGLVVFNKGFFRGTRCSGCDSVLLVSQRYSRTLVLLSILAAEAVLWITGVRKLFYPSLGVPFGFLASVALGLPVAFAILTVMVRTAPRLVAPTLVLGHWGTVNTLGLTADLHRSRTIGGAESK
jgi:hypothetical protein